jgi:fumarate hydratase class II
LTRTETDTFGPIEVDSISDRYWGAQAQRSLGNFKIGWEKQPLLDRARARHRQAGAAAKPTWRSRPSSRRRRK